MSGPSLRTLWLWGALLATGPAVAEGPQEICGQVRDGDGKPVADAEVEVAPEPGSDRVWMQRPALVTGADGTFCVDHLAPGRYSLSASKNGYASPPLGSESAGARQVVLQLRAQGVFRGRVVDLTGKPVTDFEINTLVVHSANGTYTVPSHGGREVHVRAAGYLPAVASVRGSAGGPVDVPEVVLTAVRSVRVHVEDASTHQPLSNARAILAFVEEEAPPENAGEEMEDLLEHHRDASFQRMQRNSLLSRSLRAPSDAKGELLLHELPDESLRVHVLRAGYQETTVDLEPSQSELTVRLKSLR